MQRTHLAPIAAAALALLAGASAANATQITYVLQGVTDSSPTPVALVGGFTFDTASSTFSNITIQFASNPVLGASTGVFNQGATLYHYATDQFVATDGLGNMVVLNHGSTFNQPGTFALTQAGPNSISYVFLGALAGSGMEYNVVNGSIAAVPEAATWGLLSVGLLGLAWQSRRRRKA